MFIPSLQQEKQKAKAQKVNSGHTENSHEDVDSNDDSDNSSDHADGDGVPEDSNKENKPGFNGRWYTDINEGLDMTDVYFFMKILWLLYFVYAELTALCSH